MTADDLVNTDGQLDAVERSLTVVDNGPMLSTVITLAQSYPVAREELWDVCTSSERLGCWFAPVTGELRLGGRYQIEGNAEGTIQVCDPPNGFTATWEFGEEISQIIVRIEAAGQDRSRVVLKHVADVDLEYWREYGPGAGGVGWDLALLGLAHHLATGSTQPAETTAWAETEEAKQFIADSSRRWADQFIDAGTPEPDARAAQERTTSAFLGEQPADDSAEEA